MTRAPIPHGVGLYFAVLQLLFTLGWTTYGLYLPQLAASVGIPRSTVIWILMMDQAIFVITDFLMGWAADRVSHLVGRLGRLVVAITVLSCAAFLALPFVAELGPAATPVFLALTIIWAASSSALRAPPLVLLGKYAASSTIPWLSGLALLGTGVAGALAPYLTLTLRSVDPRIPFAVSSLVLLVAVLSLVQVERRLARQAPADPPAEAAARPTGWLGPLSGLALVFMSAVVVLGLGYQFHSNVNSTQLFLRFTQPESLVFLMPIFWVGFNLAMLPASLITKRLGGLTVMGGASLIGAIAVLLADRAGGVTEVAIAQFVVGAAWGCILMSAVSAALAIGNTGAEGRIVGLMWSALSLAALARLATVAAGLPADPGIAAVIFWVPIAFLSLAGAALLYLSLARLHAWSAGRTI